MSYSYTPTLKYPLDVYKVNSYKFKQKCTYNKLYWGIHLGEDINKSSGTAVKSIGRGKVVYSALHPGTKNKSNWGNIVIIAHKHPKTKNVFYSVYAHLDRRRVSKGQSVKSGQIIGAVGKANTPANGWWDEEHLHFGIYVGLWLGKVLPGYLRKKTDKIKLSNWKHPSKFIEKYNNY